MVDTKTIQSQLKALKFGGSPFNQAEMRELPKVIHEGESILECANGIYEGGFALLVATDQRLLLIDKKPFNYMNVEDMRFDTISEIDYSHRMVGATINISAGSKTLRFKSYNQPRLRNLINLVQERISGIKKEQSDKQENQQQHLEEINKQLQMYLLAQQQQLQQQVSGQKQQGEMTEMLKALKPDPQLSDYLFAQRLLEQFQQGNDNNLPSEPQTAAKQPAKPTPKAKETIRNQDLLSDAKQEIFGAAPASPSKPAATKSDPTVAKPQEPAFKGLDINPLNIAYSKLPMMLRNRKFGRPSLHAHSQQPVTTTQQQPAS